MSNAGKKYRKYRYVANIVKEDYGMDIEDLVAAVLLAHGPPPPTKKRPFTDNKNWKRAVGEWLRDAVPEASREMASGYTSLLVTYMMRAHMQFYGRLDSNFHDQAVYQIKAARKRVRDAN